MIQTRAAAMSMLAWLTCDTTAAYNVPPFCLSSPTCIALFSLFPRTTGVNMTSRAYSVSTVSLHSAATKPSNSSCPKATGLISVVTSPVSFFPHRVPTGIVLTVNDNCHQWGTLRSIACGVVRQQSGLPPLLHWKSSLRKLPWRLYCRVIGPRKAPVE